MTSAPFLCAMKTFMNDNENIFSTEGLSVLLDEAAKVKQGMYTPVTHPALADEEMYTQLMDLTPEQRDAYDRLFLDYSPATVDLVPERFLEDVTTYLDLIKTFGAERALKLAHYHIARSNVHKLQEIMDIPCLHAASTGIVRGNVLQYVAKSDQLAVIKNDKPLLKKSAKEIGKFFLEVIQVAPKYKLSIMANCDDGQILLPTTYSKVKKKADKSVYATLEFFGLYKTDPDSIRVDFAMGWDEDNDPEKIVSFFASKPN